MFGGGGSISIAGMDPGAVADVRTVLDVIGLLTDRDRGRVKADLASYAAAIKEAVAIREEIARREQHVRHREQEVMKTAEVLARREADAGERDQAQQRREQHLNEMQAQIDAFRADVKERMAA
jgi:hypothetical protein